MIDLPIYAFTIPLTLLFLSSAILYEIRDYDESLFRTELAVAAHKIAGELVNSELAESRAIAEGETKTWPNKLRWEINLTSVDVPPGYGILITLGNETIFSRGELTGEVYSVNRVVLYQGKPAVLRVSLGR